MTSFVTKLFFPFYICCYLYLRHDKNKKGVIPDLLLHVCSCPLCFIFPEMNNHFNLLFSFIYLLLYSFINPSSSLPLCTDLSKFFQDFYGGSSITIKLSFLHKFLFSFADYSLYICRSTCNSKEAFGFLSI